jgi:hypothetical protein
MATGLLLNCEFLPDPKCNVFMVSWASLKYVTKLLKCDFIKNFLNIRPRCLKPIAYGKDIGIYRFYCFESPSSIFGKVTIKFTFFIKPMCQRHVPQAEFLIVRHGGMFLKGQATLTNCTGAPRVSVCEWCAATPGTNIVLDIMNCVIATLHCCALHWTE